MRERMRILTIDGVDVLFDPGSSGVEPSLLMKREYESVRFTIDSDELRKSNDEFVLNIHFVNQYEVIQKIINELADTLKRSDGVWRIKLKDKYKKKIE